MDDDGVFELNNTENPFAQFALLGWEGLALGSAIDILEYEERMKNENVLRKLLVLLLLDFPLLFWRLASSLSPCLVTSWVPVGSSCGKSFTRERTSIGPSEREGGGRESCDPDKHRVSTLSRPP